MAGRIGVRLEISNGGVRQALEQFIASLTDFILLRDEDPGSPQLLLLELDSGDPDETFARIRSVQQGSPGTEIFLTSGRMDPQLLLEVLRSGVKEFLTQPLRPDEVQQAFLRFRERQAEASADSMRRSGRVIAVIGGKGGVGATTVAANLATALRLGGAAVVAVDLNLRGGDIPAFFDINPLRSIRDVDLDLSRLDNAFLGAVLSKHGCGVEILPLGDSDLAGGQVSAECVDRTLKILRTMFDFVVVDCGHIIDMASFSVLSLAANVLLVTSLTVPVIRRTKRMLDGLRGEDGAGLDPSIVQLVVNRYTERDEVILNEARDVLGIRAQWVLPREPDAARDALNNGQPIMTFSPRCGLSKAFQKMAVDLGGTTGGGAPKSSFLSGVFRSVSGRAGKQGTSTSPA